MSLSSTALKSVTLALCLGAAPLALAQSTAAPAAPPATGGPAENVTTQPATCAHCGLLLLVRDHYSRRIAAFQGVCINDEDRSEIPPIEEAFP